jgi:hypothetical protein
MSWLSIISNVLSLLRTLANWIEGAKQREAGRDEVRSDVNKATAEKLDEMAKVDDRPSDDAVAGSMRDRTF